MGFPFLGCLWPGRPQSSPQGRVHDVPRNGNPIPRINYRVFGENQKNVKEVKALYALSASRNGR